MPEFPGAGIIHLARELQLGDTVRLFEGPWGFAVVRQIADGWATFFRPYVHMDSYTHTGGVTPYIGIEEVRVPIDNERPYHVVRREVLQ